MRQEDPMSTTIAELGNQMGGRRPGLAIEESERNGQAILVATSKTTECQLPRQMREDLPHLEAAGVKILGEVAGDQLFVRAKLPAGWEIKRTDHNMWTKLCDDKGRNRASIFYKAAFYDRRAHMSMDRRFSIEGYTHQDYETIAMSTVKDGDAVVFASERFPILNDDDRYGARIPNKPPHERTPSKRDLANQQCSDWLAEHFPDWQNVSAYWD